jgi:hypothetical protein
MSKHAYNKIKAGLDSARAYLDGTVDKRSYRVHVPEMVGVRKTKTRLRLSRKASRTAVKDTEPPKET